MTYVLDVSNNNPISGNLIHASGAVALICKATEGNTFKDATYPVHRSEAQHAGIPFGGYLFLQPDAATGEAAFFLAVAKPKPGDIQPIVDSETISVHGMAPTAQRTLQCLQALEGAGYDPILYSSLSMLEAMLHYQPILKKYRMWQAQYAAQRSPIGHGATVVLWQFSATYKVQNRRFDASRLFVPLTTLLIPKGK